MSSDRLGQTCYTYARRRTRELAGVELPLDHAEALRGILRGEDPIGAVVPDGEACRAGDLLEMRLPGQRRPHVGVALSAFRGEHYEPADDGGGEIREFAIAPMRRARVIVRVVRVVRRIGGSS